MSPYERFALFFAIFSRLTVVNLMALSMHQALEMFNINNFIFADHSVVEQEAFANKAPAGLSTVSISLLVKTSKMLLVTWHTVCLTKVVSAFNKR